MSDKKTSYPILKYHGASVMTALVSAPVDLGPSFFKDEFESEGGLYPQYREKLIKNFVNNSTEEKENFNKVFYQPTAYNIFGRFDIAIISLIEDFEFSSRTFKSHCPLIERNNINFRFQVLTGPTPVIDKRDLLTHAKDTFLKKNPGRFPLLGISLLKINNGLLIGNGTDIFTAILHALQIITDKFKHDNPNIDLLIQESFSWNEITIYFFSDSFVKISELLLQLRELTFDSLLETLPEDYPIDREKILKKCLYSLFKESEEEAGTYDISKTQIFVDSSSIFGYDRTFFEKSVKDGKLDEFLMKIKDGEKVKLFSRWLIRPGHLSAIVSKIQKKYPHLLNDNIKLSIGRGDFNFPDLEIGHNLKAYIRAFDALLDSPETRDHIVDLHTIPEIEFPISSLSKAHVNQSGISMGKILRKNQNLKFSIVKHNEHLEMMRKLGVPKILSERLFSIISNYNDGISDPILFGYYVEIRNYIDEIIKFITGFEKSNRTFPSFCEELDSMFKKFETAYQNRYHQSHSLHEHSDHNIDFNGGIHQLLSSFDSAYKIICSALGEGDRAKSFAYITGYPGVSSTYYSVRLNHLHIFQPATFVAIATHEAANFLVDRHSGWYEGFTQTGSTNLSFLKDYLPGFIEEKENPIQSLKDKVKALESLKELQLINADYADVALNSISPSLFNYVITDLITYYFGYNGDSELYYFWHWNYFLQISMHYQRVNNIDLIHFMNYLLRMLILFSIVDPEFIRMKVFAPTPILQRVWDVYFELVGKFVKCLYQIEEIENFFQNAQCLAQSVTIKAFLPNGDAQEAIKKIAEEKINSSDEYLNTLLASIQKKRNIQSDIFKKNLTEGIICQYNPSEMSPIMFIQSLFQAYLEIFEEYGKKKNTLLKRDSHNGSVNLEMLGQNGKSFIENSELLFDPRGGVFTYEIGVRSKFLMIRSALIKSLWDISHKEKQNTFSSIQKDYDSK